MLQCYHMSLLNKTTWWQGVWRSRLTLFILFVVCFFISFPVYDRFVVEREMAERREEKEEELSLLTERKEYLEKRLEYISSEQGKEASIRKHFDVAREGEEVVVLVGEKEVIETASPLLPEEQEEESFWQFLIFWKN